MSENNLHTPINKFDTDAFNKVLTRIAERAGAAEECADVPEIEFSWLREVGALTVVLPGFLLDFNLGKTPEILRLLQDVGKANLSVGRIFEGHINTLYLIHLYADAAQRKRWYSEVRDKGHLFGIWNTQAGDGISFVTDEADFVVYGRKTFCSGAGLVNRALITGNIVRDGAQGWQMAIVDMDQIPGESIDADSWKPMGMLASGSFTVDFSGYRLPFTDLLAQPGTYLRQPYFNGGAIRFAAVQLGGAAAMAAHTIAYLKQLGRTEDPFQQMRIYTIMSQLTSGQLWLKQAGDFYDQWVAADRNEEALIAFANMTRTAIEEICTRILDESVRCVGARGLMAPHQLGRIHRDLTFYLRQPAPDATRINVAAFFLQNDFSFDNEF